LRRPNRLVMAFFFSRYMEVFTDNAFLQQSGKCSGQVRWEAVRGQPK
jgi:hypothetical protein